MTTINISNSTSATYSISNSSQSEITALQKERQSLQDEVQQLQSELASNSAESETIQVEIDTMQAQISTIDSQISSLQSKTSDKSSSDDKANLMQKINHSENPEALKNSLSKLSETTKMLENEIALEKGKGLNTDNKDEILENINKNKESISLKLNEFNESDLQIEKKDYQTNLVGNLVDNRA